MKKLTGIAAIALMGITMAATSLSAAAAESAAHTADMTEAVGTALKDAGLTDSDVTFTKKIHEFQEGTETFEIDFVIPSEMKYEYKVDAQSGAITGREADRWEAEDDFEYQALLAETTDYFNLDTEENGQLLAESMIAAKDAAGIADLADCCYYKTGMDYDDGMVLCKVGLLVPGEKKFDFEFDAKTGSLINSETDFWEADDDFDFAALLADVEAEAAPDEAVNTEEVTDAVAKQIALDDAGFGESEVRMKKCSRDFDDGIEQFEVSFVASDGMEYDYEISAADGRILSKDVEFDD